MTTELDIGRPSRYPPPHTEGRRPVLGAAPFDVDGQRFLCVHSVTGMRKTLPRRAALSSPRSIIL